MVAFTSMIRIEALCVASQRLQKKESRFGAITALACLAAAVPSQHLTSIAGRCASTTTEQYFGPRPVIRGALPPCVTPHRSDVFRSASFANGAAGGCAVSLIQHR